MAKQTRDKSTIRIGIGGDRIDLPKELQTLDNYSATLAHKVVITMTAMVMALRRFNSGDFGVGNGVSVLVTVAMVIWGGGS